MGKRLNDGQRRGITADVRRGEMTQVQIADKHGVSRRTVANIAQEAKAHALADGAPPGSTLVERLDRLADASERVLEMAEASNDGRELSAAIRAARDTLATVAKMRADIEREAEGGTHKDIETIKHVIVEELKDHPEVRQRVAERLLAAKPDVPRPR